MRRMLYSGGAGRARFWLGALLRRFARRARSSRSSQLPDDLAEAVAARLEVLEGVEAGAGGREQDDLAGLGGGRPPGGPRPRARRSGAARPLPRPPAPARAPSARWWRRSGSRRRRARPAGRPAARKARPSRCRRGSRGHLPSKARIPTAAEATLVAFESLTKRTPPISATGSSRCGTPAKLRRPSRDRVAVDPHRQRRRRRGHRVGDVVLAEEAELGDRQQRLAVVEDRPLGDRDLAVGGGADAEGDPAAAAAEVGAGGEGVVGVVDGDVVVALVGEDPQLRRQVVTRGRRGGRGGRGRG